MKIDEFFNRKKLKKLLGISGVKRVAVQKNWFAFSQSWFDFTDEPDGYIS